jgi:hypothetical protein
MRNSTIQETDLTRGDARALNAPDSFPQQQHTSAQADDTTRGPRRADDGDAAHARATDDTPRDDDAAGNARGVDDDDAAGNARGADDNDAAGNARGADDNDAAPRAQARDEVSTARDVVDATAPHARARVETTDPHDSIAPQILIHVPDALRHTI